MMKVAKVGIAIAAVVAMIVPAAFAGIPDTGNSFYVPEAIVGAAGPMAPAAVVDGTSVGGDISNPGNSIFYFKACPNNHGGGSGTLLGFCTNNARVKVKVRDGGGAPIAGIAAGDICILLNGGTVAQGFSGAGADSLIANNSLPSTPLCPNVRCIQADGPTDAAGVAYITLTGANGIRDPNRKWGHFDSVMPVFVLGFPITGRLSDGSAHGSYVLSVRNVDHAGGLTDGIGPNQADVAEAVSAADFNVFNNPAFTGSYATDFDGNGFKSAADSNVINGHLGHTCVLPNP